MNVSSALKTTDRIRVKVAAIEIPQRYDRDGIAKNEVFSFFTGDEEGNNEPGFAVITDELIAFNAITKKMGVAYIAFSSDPQKIGKMYSFETSNFEYLIFIEDLNAIKKYVKEQYPKYPVEEKSLPVLFFEKHILDKLELKTGNSIELFRLLNWYVEKKLPKDLTFEEIERE